MLSLIQYTMLTQGCVWFQILSLTYTDKEGNFNKKDGNKHIIWY